jgi:hypothetical protein
MEKPWYKRWWGILIIFFAIIILVNIADKQIKHGTSATSPLDREARDIAQKNVFDKIIIKCGDLIYMRTFWNMVGDRQYQRFKTSEIGVSSIPLSEADKMNGVEWKGVVSFKCIGPSQRADQYQGYDQWTDRCENRSVGLQKQRGKWDLDFVEPGNPITCEEALNPTVRR